MSARTEDDPEQIRRKNKIVSYFSCKGVALYIVLRVSLLLCLRCPLHTCCNATATFVFCEQLIADLVESHLFD